MIVVDASLAVKWYFLEQGSDAAIAVFKLHFGRISAPDIFGVEVLSTLVREANGAKAKAAAIQTQIIRFQQLLEFSAVTLINMTPAQLKSAADIAIELGHPLKDCIYLALAMEHDCGLITCDARFAVRAKTIWPSIKLLTEMH
jgi:predicted nucleic acid-binding protein